MHFYHRFWGQFPDHKKWTLYTMKGLTRLPMLKGSVVHKVVATGLKTIAAGDKFDTGDLRKMVTELIRKPYMQSAKAWWNINNRPPGVKPSEITTLYEHYYKVISIDTLEQRVREARDSAVACLEALFASDYWEKITGGGHGWWQEIEGDEIPSFDFEGIKVYAKVDFAHQIHVPTIVDWKTGREKDDDIRQLFLYALYAQAAWDWNPTDMKLDAVYLSPEGVSVESFTPTKEDIESLFEHIRQSYQEMSALEPEPGKPADIELFPRSENGLCRRCNFRGVCQSHPNEADHLASHNQV